MHIDDIIVETSDINKPNFNPHIIPAISVIGEQGKIKDDNIAWMQIKMIGAQKGFSKCNDNNL